MPGAECADTVETMCLAMDLTHTYRYFYCRVVASSKMHANVVQQSDMFYCSPWSDEQMGHLWTWTCDRLAHVLQSILHMATFTSMTLARLENN